MNKERKVIEENLIVVFNKDVTAKDLRMYKYDSITIVVNGNLLLENSLRPFYGDLYIMGDILSEYPYYSISIAGNLYCYGKITAGNIFVSKYLYSKGCIDSYTISVCEDLYCQDDIDSTDIDVEGDFYCKGDVSSYYFEINVGGDFECEKNVITEGLNVFGESKVGGTIEKYKK